MTTTICAQMKQPLTKVIFIKLCLLLAPYYSYSLPFYGNTTLVTLKSGLNYNTIYDIHSGKKNFIWFSTDMGLSRFDGFRVRNYPLVTKHDSLSQPVIHAVRSISEDMEGLLYLQLLQGGIACFDQDGGTYLPVLFEKPFDAWTITSLYAVNSQLLYIGTRNGLYTGMVVRSGKGEDEKIMVDVSAQPLIKGNITNLHGADGKFVFVVVDQTRIAVCDVLSGNARMLDRKEGKGKITSIYQKGDYLWIGALQSDIECYDLQKNTSRVIHDAGNSGYPRISDTYVTGIVRMDENIYCVSTWTGLYRLKFDSRDLIQSACKIDHVDRFHQIGMDQQITDLFWDDTQKLLWVGTFGSGVLKIDFTEDAYNRLDQQINADVTEIEEDMKGFVWITTGDGRVLRSAGNKLEVNTSFEPWTKGLKAEANYRMYKDGRGRLWFGDKSEEIVCIDPSTDEVTSYRLEPKGISDFKGTINSFCLDSRNRLWITSTEGLLLFNLSDNQCSLISLEDKVRKVKIVTAVAEDKEGNIWLGTDAGLKRIELHGDKGVLLGDYEQEAGLPISAVYSIYVNSYNQILVSYTDKILRIDGREKDKVESAFTLLNGLSSGHIFCMVDDQNGNTWVGSNSGIMTIRNDRTSFYNYGSFGNCNRVCRLRDGRLLWANSWGLIFFDPLSAKLNSNKDQLCMSDVRVNGEPVSVGEEVNGQVILSESPDLQREFVFNANNDDFTFYFSDMQYGMMERKMAYRLLPDEEWKMETLENGISYRRLPVGNYTLQVKLVYPDASEGELIEIPIRIKTHWWNTGWAYIGYALFCFGVFAVVFYYLDRKAKRRELHKAHEMELKETLNLSKMKQEQKQEIETMRNQLLTIFVQELRTPLSLIIAPLKEMSNEVTLPPGMLSKVRVAYRNSLGMLDACNQLLSIYTQRPLAEKLKVASYSADKIVDEVVFSVSELVKINQIDFQYEKRTRKEMELWVDKGRIRFVLHNLISNAFNHVRLSGSVHLFMQETVREGIHYCTIVVSDNGKSQVRDVRQAVEEGLKTDLTGIELGYDVMERVISLHHGTIAMKSEEGEGTEITIDLPIGKELLENDPNIIFVEQVDEEEVPEPIPLVREVQEKVLAPEEIVPQIVHEAPVSPKAKKTLLIVEDHKDIRLYLKVLFGKDYNILMAVNGQEGVDMAVKEQPDLILCDVMMPVKDGFECCREVKEGLDTCHIPFIMLTAKVEDEDIIHGLELGADDYILKPFTPGILKAKVRNLINGRINLKQMYTKLLMVPENGGEGEHAEDGEISKMEDPFISSLVKIIEENIREADFNVKKLASEMNMSQPTLYRKVKQSTDFTIIELIRGVRMKKAAVLLKKKIYAVQEVAEMVGYNDIPTFRKHFVDAFGTTPSTYANSLENS